MTLPDEVSVAELGLTGVIIATIREALSVSKEMRSMTLQSIASAEKSNEVLQSFMVAQIQLLQQILKEIQSLK